MGVWRRGARTGSQHAVGERGVVVRRRVDFQAGVALSRRGATHWYERGERRIGDFGGRDVGFICDGGVFCVGRSCWLRG